MFRLDKNIASIPVGENHCRFNERPLEEALKKVVFDVTKNSETPLADKGNPSCPVFVLTTRGKVAGQVKLLKSYTYYMDECPIWQAARATTAAPTYFPAAWVSIPTPGEWYIDGGITQNNPSPQALVEGKEHWKARRCLLVSIGTGIQKHADLVGERKTPKDNVEPEVNRPAAPSHFEYLEAAESTSLQSEQSTESLFGGMKKGLRTGAARLGESIQIATSSIRPTLDKAAQTGRVVGGISTTIHLTKELVKISTQCEKTHREIYSESRSRDPSSRFTYYRFNVRNGMEEVGLEEWKKRVDITSLTRDYLDSPDVGKELEECAKVILNPAEFEGM